MENESNIIKMKPEVIDKFPSFKRHHITQKIIDVMINMEPGEKISYSRLMEISGVDCQKKRSYLDSAIRILRREHKIVFKCIITWGYCRATSEEIGQGVGRERGKKIKTQNKIALEELAAVNFDELSDSGKTKHNTSVALFGALNIFLKPSKQKKLEKEIEYQGKAIDFNQTLKLFEK